MADYERKSFRGGFNNNRKRRYRDDSDPDHRQQRRRYEEPLHIKLRRQLLGLAESPARNPEDEIATTAKTAVELFGDDEHRSNMITVLKQMVFEQPPKIPFLAALVMACNLEKPELAIAVLGDVADSVQNHMRNGAWREVKLGLRLLVCLQVMLEGDGVFPVLEELFSRAVDLQTTSSEDALGLELVKIILTSIAYLMASPSTDFEDRAAALLEKTDIIASAPHALEALVQPFQGVGDSDAEQWPSMIGVLQRGLQNEAAGGWELKCLPQPWKSVFSEKPAGECPKHALPDIQVPSPAPIGHRLRFPELYLSVYSDQEVETVPPPENVTCALVRDVLADSINVLDFNRNVTAKFLIELDCFFAPGMFASRGTPFDKLKDIPDEKSKWKPEDVAVDAVFSQLLQLPTPEHKLVYFHSVLTEACKLAPAAIAPSLGRAIRFLYRNLKSVDLELQSRYLDWFSHHLSNFGFTWKWTEWADDITLPSSHERKAFIAAVLEKEIRLSVVQRVRSTLPEPYHRLLVNLKDDDEPPDFKYANDSTPHASDGRELLQLIRKKATESEVQEVLDRIQGNAQASGHEDPTLAPVDVYTNCVCFAGSKSLSHLLSYIERCKERLLMMSASSETAKEQIITSVMDYWSEKPGTGTNIVDKLLNYSIISPMSLVRWTFENRLLVDGGIILTQAHIFELVAGTMAKVTNRVRQIATARSRGELPQDQLALLDQTLAQEQADMRGLFEVLESKLQAFVDASSAGIEQQSELISWARRWLRVFQRKLQVEESWLEQEAPQGHGDTKMANGDGEL